MKSTDTPFPRIVPTCFCALLLALCVIISASAADADGEFNTTFGTNGTVFTSFGQSYDGIYSLAIDSQGNIVAGGCSFYPGESDFALARYKPNGELDTSFGTNGLVSADLHGSYDFIEALVLDDNGNIVAGGSAFEPHKEDSEFALARYKPNGELDTSFGTNGLVFTDFEDSDDDSIYSLVIDSEGNIVAGGHFYNDSTNLMNFALARYKPNGELDPSFGTGGWIAAAFDGMPSVLGSIALDGDGNIVAGGYRDTQGTGKYDFVIARYTTDGELDTTFGTDGLVSADFGGGDDFLESMVIDGDGNIVAGGYSHNIQTDEDDFVMARYTEDGELDTTFGTNGLVSTDFGRNDKISSLSVDSYGNIVAGGTSYGDGGSDEIFVLARYKPNGELDSSFGTDGWTSPDLGGDVDVLQSVVINGNGDIIAGGYDFRSATSNFALASFKGAPPAESVSLDGCNAVTLPGMMILLALPLTLLHRKAGK